MNESRMSKAADMSTCNHDYQNKWNKITDMAAITRIIIRKTTSTMNGIQQPTWQLTSTSTTKIIKTTASTMNGIPKPT
jgi:hypothetical protein